ncbi:endonuclease [Paludibacter sp.]
MCYNVENYFDCVDDSLTRDEEFLPGGMRGWNYSRYVRKQHNIAKVIVSADSWESPEIVGLCEVESHKCLYDLVLGPLHNLHYRFSHFESPDLRGVDVALLYKPESFKLISEEPVKIVFPSNSNSKTRDILYVTGNVKSSNDTLHIFVCHFPSRLGGELDSEEKRLHVAKVLRDKVDYIFDSYIDPKIIIMGDFNDYPDNKSMFQVLNAVSPDTENIVQDQLYNLMFPLHQKRMGTHKHYGDWGALDQIIVSGNLLNDNKKLFTRVSDVTIHKPDFLLEDDEKFLGKKPFRTYVGFKYHGGYSDHLPVYVDFYINRSF